jgi:hypothetical protein
MNGARNAAQRVWKFQKPKALLKDSPNRVGGDSGFWFSAWKQIGAGETSHFPVPPKKNQQPLAEHHKAVFPAFAAVDVNQHAL